mgnify:CR=1 FL=1
MLCIPFSAFAEGEASAFLSDVSTEKNRLFETTFSVNVSVSAFVATLEFDESKVSFRSAKALSEKSEISVNSSGSGKVRLAFLNEYGTQGEIVKFTFKASDKNAYIGLKLEQVIDKNAEDITLTSVTGSSITVSTNSTDSKSNSNKEKAEQEIAEASPTAHIGNNEDIIINVPAKKSSDIWLIVSVSLGTLLLVTVGVTGFVLGKKSGKDRKN